MREIVSAAREGPLSACEAAIQAVLAGAVSYSPLFGNFLDLIVRGLYRRLKLLLKPQH